MKRISLLLVVAGIAVVAVRAEDDAVKKELAKFKGTWRVVSMEMQGNKIPDAIFKDFKLILDGDQHTSIDSMNTSTGTFKVDLTKKPKEIDIDFKDGPSKGQTLKGIYELDGDTYKLCLAMTPGKERPKEFASKPGSGHALEVLKREKK